jgi:hypothetical protein
VISLNVNYELLVPKKTEQASHQLRIMFSIGFDPHNDST